ncbi:MAG: thioredoxin domain-containing protein [bacterium]|nr:thioredoxin domain-containing protein [bacterium]
MDEQLTKKERRELRRQERKEGVSKARQQRGLKRLLLWLGVVAFFGLGVWGVVALVPEPPETEEGSDLPVLTGQDHFKGPEDASVVLVEYGDFQCPACRSYFSLVQQLEEEFSDQVKFVYRNYPLRQIHPQAQLASQAAEAAALQGKFWEMYDMLFEAQLEWAGDRNAKDVFIGYAAELGLNEEQFAADFDSSQVKDKVQADLSGGNVAGVTGTPSFFLQGKRIVNPQNYDAFQALILQTL